MQPASLDPTPPADQSRWIPRFLRPPPPAPQISDPAQIAAGYKFFRPRILLWSTIGYGIFYFVRKNYSVAMAVMINSHQYQKTDLGLILTLHGVLYGVSKFLNGMAADRANARLFMATALIACAVLNVFFGLSSSLPLFSIIWMANGWFQGMGYPPCARLLTHWFAPRELASKMSIWNISHSLGGATIVVLCGYIIALSGNWRLCFFIPAIIALLMGVILLLNLRDTPESVGLPPVESTPMPRMHGRIFCSSIFLAVLALSAVMYYYHYWNWIFCVCVVGVAAAMMILILANLQDVPVAVDAPPHNAPPVPPSENPDDPSAPSRHFLWTHVFSNKYIWLVSIANFFVYTLRFAIFDWGPTLLSEYKGMKLPLATSIVAGFEIAGLFGMLTTGWLTDRFFRGRAVPLCLISMVLAGLSIALFWLAAGNNIWLNSSLLAAAGFCIYCPQALLAVVAANLATKKAAATAVGLTSIFGYASTTLSGYGMGWLSQKYGWPPAFAALIVVAICGAFLFALALPAKAHGYDSPQP